MKKDVIYIDVEDDISSVIEKLKNSSEKIVALVPPKGNSVLQSVVNLRLLHRAADKVDKRPVIVSSNQALAALAGGIGLYVAKTLQSKPTIPSGIDFDGDDTAVEVSDDVGSLKVNDPAESTDGDNDEVELSGNELAALTAENKADRSEATKKSDKKKKKKKVPNFNSFRKKALIFGGIGLLALILLLAIFGRTSADITIRAETSPIDVELAATISSRVPESDLENNTLKAQRQEIKKTLTQEFRATGKKDVGDRATGTVRIRTSAETILISGLTVPAGTEVSSSGGRIFITTEAAVFSQGDPSGLGGVEVDIRAKERGSQFNGQSGSASTSASGVTSVSFVGSTSGGTDKTVTVISQGDVDRARKQLEEQDEAAIKKELQEAFDGDVRVFEDSFVANLGNARSEPAVGQESNEGRLTVEATYSMLAVSNETLGAALDAYILAEIPNKDQQRVYDNGLEDAVFTRGDGTAEEAQYVIASVGQYGPRFDTDALKEEISGKKVGEARSYLQDLPGVKGIDIDLGPFWARQLPNEGRIEIKLEVDENISG